VRDTRYVDLRDAAVRAMRAAVDAYEQGEYGRLIDIVEQEAWVIRELDKHPSRGLAFDNGPHSANAL